MKVITLDKIVQFIENKHGKQELNKLSFNGRKIAVIHDINTVCPEPYLVDSGEIGFKGLSERVHCVLFDTELNDFDKPNPFIKSREALSGHLLIDGVVPLENEIYDYFYFLSHY